MQTRSAAHTFSRSTDSISLACISVLTSSSVCVLFTHFSRQNRFDVFLSAENKFSRQNLSYLPQLHFISVSIAVMQVANKSPIVIQSRGARFLDLVRQNKLNVSPQLTVKANRRFSLDARHTTTPKNEKKEYFNFSSEVKYNPDASPSSGILMKRKADNDSPANSSNKVRNLILLCCCEFFNLNLKFVFVAKTRRLPRSRLVDQRVPHHRRRGEAQIKFKRTHPLSRLQRR